MRSGWEDFLDRWTRAGLLDDAAARHIGAFEAATDERQLLDRAPVGEIGVEVAVPGRGLRTPLDL